MYLFAISKVVFRYLGILWSLLTLGCGILWPPLDLLGSTSAQADGALSDSDSLLKRDDFWWLSHGGAIAAGRFQEVGSWGCAMTVSARLHVFGSGTLVVCSGFSQSTWPTWRISSWWSKSSSIYQMIRWTLQCPHCRHHRFPDRHPHPESLMRLGILVIHNTMHKGR